MDQNKFLENFREQFDETEEDQIKMGTIFKDLEEWSSMHALLIIAMIDAEYDVTFSGEDLRNTKTVEEIFNIVSGRKTA